LGLGRNPRYRHIIEEQRRLAEKHIKEIQAEQDQRNAACAGSSTVTSRFCGSPSGIPLEGLGGWCFSRVGDPLIGAA
jgi:hypothetical protein